MRSPLGLLGLPSVQSIVEGLVEFFFQDLARALVPDFLKKASVASLRWLVAVPDPTAWPHVSQLEGDMAAVAVALLAVSFTAAVVRYLAVGVAGGGSPLQPLSSTVSSAALLLAYRWMAHEAVVGVNAFTGTVLAFPVVGSGLQRTVGVLFGGALLVGSGSLFFALLVIVAVVFAAVMFAVKVLLLVGVGLLYVTGMLAIAARPLGSGAGFARAWLSVAATVAMVPIGWTILFASAGTLSLDATSFGAGGAGGGLPGHVAAALAAVLTFYLAVKVPVAALSHLRASIVGVASGARVGGGGAAGGGAGGGGGVGRVADAHSRLRAGTLQAGRSLGSAAGALGAPAGGAVGLAARAAARLAGPVGMGLGLGLGLAGGARKSGSAGEQAGAGGLKGRLGRAGAGDGAGARRDGATGGSAAGAARPAVGGEAPLRQPRPDASAREGSARASGQGQRSEEIQGNGISPARKEDDGRRRPELKTPPAVAAGGSARGGATATGAAGGAGAGAGGERDARARREGTRVPVRKPAVARGEGLGRSGKARAGGKGGGSAPRPRTPVKGQVGRPRSGGREARSRRVRRPWWRFGRGSGSGGE